MAATHYGDTTGIAGWRIKINPDNVATTLLQPGLLRHELTHFVLRNVNVGNPTWLVEGVAEVLRLTGRRSSRTRSWPTPTTAG